MAKITMRKLIHVTPELYSLARKYSETDRDAKRICGILARSRHNIKDVESFNKEDLSYYMDLKGLGPKYINVIRQMMGSLPVYHIKKQTRRKKIQSMNTQQLAKFLAEFYNVDMVPKMYACNTIHGCRYCINNYICFQNWLNEEVEEDIQ